MILLAGATGFLGSRLLSRLLGLGHRVVCLKRKQSDCSWVEKMPRGYSRWYDCDRVSMEEIFAENEIDIVIHCATNYGRGKRGFIDAYEANVSFPMNIVKYAELYGCKYFINTGSFFEKIIKGLWETNEELYMDAYVKSKFIFRNIIKDQIQDLQLSFINLQLEHTYGDGDRETKFVNFLVDSLSQNVPNLELSEGKQNRDWIYFEDVISAYEVILQNISQFGQGKYYSFEVGTGQRTSLREFVITAKDLVGSDTNLLFGKAKMHKNELMDSCADNEPLRKLGWQPVYHVEDGLKKMIDAAILSERILEK